MSTWSRIRSGLWLGCFRRRVGIWIGRFGRRVSSWRWCFWYRRWVSLVFVVFTLWSRFRRFRSVFWFRHCGRLVECGFLSSFFVFYLIVIGSWFRSFVIFFFF